MLRTALLVLCALGGSLAVYAGGRTSPDLVTFLLPASATFWAMHVRLAIGRWPSVLSTALLATALALAGGGVAFPLCVLAIATVGSESIASATRRSEVLRAGVRAGLTGGLLGALLTWLPLATATVAPLRDVGWAWLLAAGPASAAAVLLVGAPLEWLFGHVTRITLSEWLHYDHPLIRLLSLRAPGTFQHSINVGLLADAAARAVGADALLARVGGLYHDVGKTAAPQYFVENQRGSNPHDDLAAEGSAAILRAHVTDGVALVLSHGMGERIASFVREHHGTTTMRSLLEKAAATGHGPEAESICRYPGPRPGSRETAIVMMADQIEATARAVMPADEQACAKVVGDTIARIDSESQLAEVDFSRSDLDRIRDAFVRVLSAMYHQRLAYPAAEVHPAKRRLTLMPTWGRGRTSA